MALPWATGRSRALSWRTWWKLLRARRTGTPSTTSERDAPPATALARDPRVAGHGSARESRRASWQQPRGP
eukprot:4581152-Prymnesium_polylepis.3